MHLSLTLTGYFRICTLKVNVSHPSGMFGRKVLGEVIGKIFSSLLPVEAESVRLDAAENPLAAHVKCFGAFPAHISGEDSVGGFVVSFCWS